MSKKIRVPQKPKAYTAKTFVQEPEWKEPKIKLKVGKNKIKHKLSIFKDLD